MKSILLMNPREPGGHVCIQEILHVEVFEGKL